MLQWPNLRPDSDDHSCVRPRGPRKLTPAGQSKARPAVTASRFLVVAGAATLIAAISIGPFPTRLAAQTAAPIPYENMPEIAPPGVRIGKHIDVPDSAKGPAVDAAKGYRLQRLGRNLYTVTENAYQSMFLVHESGVVVVDAPPSHAPDSQGDRRSHRQADHPYYLQSFTRRSYRRCRRSRRTPDHHRPRGDQEATCARQRSEPAVADRNVRRHLYAQDRRRNAGKIGRAHV